ncbi:MAG: exosortase system-associated protein, TIGR04073 family [Methylococcaceae bacterium]|nr:exosortase system-associated protein, TIGR04073 family [Methylococcaceae bacterium]
MNHFKQSPVKQSLAAFGLALLLAFSSQTQADDQESRSSPFVIKASHGLANMIGGFVEIPKNVTNITQDSNIFAGVTIGLLRGVVHTVSRTLVGTAEFITSPFPTKDYITPGYVWERFSEDTRYFGLHYPLYWTSFGPLDEGENLRPQ